MIGVHAIFEPVFNEIFFDSQIPGAFNFLVDLEEGDTLKGGIFELKNFFIEEDLVI